MSDTVIKPPETPSLTLDVFVEATIAVLEEIGVEEFQPTLALPALAKFQTIEGIPESVDHRDAIQGVIRRANIQTQEFFFAVRSGAQRVTCGHHRPGLPTVFADIERAPDAFEVEALTACSWWTVS